VAPVGENSELIQALGISRGFSFSRTPVKAVIETKVFGLVCVYVVHLKSKRALYSRKYTNEDSLKDKALLEMLGQSQGKVSSLLQRGTEAACLAADVMLDQHFSGLPTVVLGDINCDFRSVEYDALCPKGGLRLEGVETDAQKVQVTELYDKLRLHSAFSSAEVNSDAPTHYYKGKGSTLDYIFVSNELENKVKEHKVWNTHMVDPSTEKVIKNRDYKESTDHAIVSIELKHS
jgi:endonuclease/exonuclease/phosphatase family metal-dependent hydrolase